jgi:hypothetical protein
LYGTPAPGRNETDADAGGIVQKGQIVVEARGSHFVAWEADEAGRPREAILMVGQTAEEAEERLKTWLAARAQG